MISNENNEDNRDIYQLPVNLTNIRISIPTNDGISIFKGMLGQAEKFLIFDKSKDEDFQFIEERNNHHAASQQHLKTNDIYDILDDCEIILSVFIGKKGIDRLIKKGVTLIFRKGDITKNLNEINNKLNGLKILK